MIELSMGGLIFVGVLILFALVGIQLSINRLSDAIYSLRDLGDLSNDLSEIAKHLDNIFKIMDYQTSIKSKVHKIRNALIDKIIKIETGKIRKKSLKEAQKRVQETFEDVDFIETPSDGYIHKLYNVQKAVERIEKEESEAKISRK